MDSIHVWNAGAILNSPKIKGFIKMPIDNRINRVRIVDQYTEFTTDMGARQGDGLVIVLLNLSLKKVIQGSRIDENGTLVIKGPKLLAWRIISVL